MSESPKIFDCFTFFNEYDLLELRLSYLYSHVDHFVIVESDQTFNGASKAFNFDGNMERYAQYLDKITYVQVAMPNFRESKKVAWKREAYQRNEIKKGLEILKAQPDDVVMMGDVDEIPNIEVVNQLKEENRFKVQSFSNLDKIRSIIACLFGLIIDLFKGISENRLRLKQLMISLNDEQLIPILFRMDNFYYFVNNREKRRNIWKGTLWLKYSVLNDFSLDDLRELRRFPLRAIDSAGWHFSYLGGIKLIKHKLRNFSHQEYNTDQIVNDDYIKFCIENGFSLFSYFKDKNISPEFERLGANEFPTSLKNIIVNYPQLFYK